MRAIARLALAVGLLALYALAAPALSGATTYTGTDDCTGAGSTTTATEQRCEAELINTGGTGDLAKQSAASASQGYQVKFNANGGVGAEWKLTATKMPAGEGTFNVIARADSGCPGPNGWPAGQASVDGGAAVTVQPTSTTFASFGFAVNITPGQHVISVVGPGISNGSCHFVLDYVAVPRFKAFASTSPWNTPLSGVTCDSGAHTGSNCLDSQQTWQNTELGSSVQLPGAQSNTDYGVPTYFTGFSDSLTCSATPRTSACGGTGPMTAFVGDSSYSGFGNRWNTGDQSRIPVGVYPEDCGWTHGDTAHPPVDACDGHLSMINPARELSYELYHALPVANGAFAQIGTTSAPWKTGYNQLYNDPGDTTSVDNGSGTEWDTSSAGTGYVAHPAGWEDPPSSGDYHLPGGARGSSTTLVPTTLRADEALYGIPHALGCTTTGSVSTKFLYPPAGKSDKTSNPNGLHVRYGERWVLPSSFTYSGSSPGIANIVTALKTYGCFVVDAGEGDGFGIDLDTNNSALWSAAQVTNQSDLASLIAGADFRRVRDDSQTEWDCDTTNGNTHGVC